MSLLSSFDQFKAFLQNKSISLKKKYLQCTKQVQYINYLQKKSKTFYPHYIYNNENWQIIITIIKIFPLNLKTSVQLLPHIFNNWIGCASQLNLNDIKLTKQV